MAFGLPYLLIIFCPILVKVFVVSVCSKAIMGLPWPTNNVGMRFIISPTVYKYKN